LDQVFRCAGPLQPHQRAAFLEHLGAQLQGQREVGDGQLWRLICEAQRLFHDLPDIGSNAARRREIRALIPVRQCG
jgi:hypothetical protein